MYIPTYLYIVQTQSFNLVTLAEDEPDVSHHTVEVDGEVVKLITSW